MPPTVLWYHATKFSMVVLKESTQEFSVFEIRVRLMSKLDERKVDDALAPTWGAEVVVSRVSLYRKSPGFDSCNLQTIHENQCW